MKYPNTADLMYRARKKKNLSLADMANELGTGRQFIHLVERGERNIPYDLITKFCEVTGYKLETVKRAAVKDFAHRFEEKLKS